jgi:hypothetical protein
MEAGPAAACKASLPRNNPRFRQRECKPAETAWLMRRQPYCGRCLTSMNAAAIHLALLFATVTTFAQDVPVNCYKPYPRVAEMAEGTSWPKGQALPTFATPAAVLDTITVQDLSRDEQILFSSLQGQVNRQQPRIYLLNERADEGRDTWANTGTMSLGERKRYGRRNKYEIVRKYVGEVQGAVLYDPAISPHYRNLAGTVAALNHALPVTAEILVEMKRHGIELEVLVDLTTLGLVTPIDIYTHLYEHYWNKCVKRLIVSAKPFDRGGDLHHTRDIAAACGAAVVWLDTLIPEERGLLRKFFAEMQAGDAIVLGWYATERSGITTASEFGIGTMPADFYVSGSVYSGTSHQIKIPVVPKMPTLANKVYVALFISDGDNIQYTQHAMRKIWDQNARHRGRIPLNWTIAPGLVDIGPGILNYYYTTATANDCFVTGPSGMGYLMPFNTLDEPGAPVGNYLKDSARMDGYAELTETYLQRSGLRVVTIWDNATPMQRASYTKHCRNLYGATVQNFRDVRSVAASVENNRVRFDKLVIPYASTYEHLHSSLAREIRRWDGKSPRFLSYQADVWHELKPDRLVQLHDHLMEEFPDKVKFVRADHYFNLYNQANGLPFNLCLSDKTRATVGAGTLETIIDGTPATLWAADETGPQDLLLDFGAAFEISRYVIRHAGDHGMNREHNTREFNVSVSIDGNEWSHLHRISENYHQVSDFEFPALRARYLKISIVDPGVDSTARVADIEVFGTR